MKKRLISLLAVFAMISGCFAGGVSAAETAKFTVYLSPSSQFANYYCTTGNEELAMRQVAQAMIPYLEAYGIDYVMAKEKRDLPENTWSTLLQQRAEEAEEKGCDLYLAIHSNAAPTKAESGLRRGADIYYYTQKLMSRYWAEIIRDHYCYPDPNLVQLATNDMLIDMHTPAMPSVLVETAYHDNVEDAVWIQQNIGAIAHSLAYSVAEYRFRYYGVPFQDAGDSQEQADGPLVPLMVTDVGTVWGVKE